MLSFVPGLSTGRQAYLPRRRWRIRGGRPWLRLLLGGLLGAAIPFYLWWIELLPLWVMLLPALAGAAVALPAPLVLGMDERGIALIVPAWLRDRHLWIPQERLIRLDIESGWLVATGSEVEAQGELNCLHVMARASIPVPDQLRLVMNSRLVANTIIFPIALLDSVARDEIELWMFRERRAELLDVRC